MIKRVYAGAILKRAQDVTTEFNAVADTVNYALQMTYQAVQNNKTSTIQRDIGNASSALRSAVDSVQSLSATLANVPNGPESAAELQQYMTQLSDAIYEVSTGNQFSNDAVFQEAAAQYTTLSPQIKNALSKLTSAVTYGSQPTEQPATEPTTTEAPPVA